MRKLESVDGDELRAALEDAEDAKAAKRLMVALAYADGVDAGTIARRYGIPRSTVYYWLDRFDSEPVEAALADDPRPGRPPKLAVAQREAVESWLDDPPAARGLDAAEWTAELLSDEIREAFDVDYSVPHVRRTFLR